MTDPDLRNWTGPTGLRDESGNLIDTPVRYTQQLFCDKHGRQVESHRFAGSNFCGECIREKLTELGVHQVYDKDVPDNAAG